MTEKNHVSKETQDISNDNQHVPTLRFKEFDDNYINLKLEDIAKFSKGKGISKKEISEDGISCIRYGELYTLYNEIIDKVYSKTKLNKEKLILSQSNDIIIPSSGETAIDISTASCVLKDNIALGGDINIIKTKQNGPYLAYYLNYKKHDIAKLAQGASVVHLYANELKKLNLNIPSIKEQEKVVNFLNLIENKIELLEKKLKNIINLKKYYLNLIFNSKNFKNKQWDKKLLGNLSTITTGKLDANAMVENGKYRFYTCAKEYYLINNYAFDKEALLISGNGANVGYIHYYKGKFNAYQRTYVLYNFKEINIRFVQYYLEKFLKMQILKEKNEGNTPYIVLGTLKNMMIHFPSKIQQDTIVNLMIHFDTKIFQNKKRINLIKNFKKFLLQKMFV